MMAAFPSKCPFIVGESNLQELIHILHCFVQCVQSLSTEYDEHGCLLYFVVALKHYKLYAPLVRDTTADPVVDGNGV